MAGDMLTYPFVSGISKGMCLYIDLFCGVTFGPMFITLNIGLDNEIHM